MFVRVSGSVTDYFLIVNRVLLFRDVSRTGIYIQTTHQEYTCKYNWLMNWGAVHIRMKLRMQGFISRKNLRRCLKFIQTQCLKRVQLFMSFH